MPGFGSQASPENPDVESGTGVEGVADARLMVSASGDSGFLLVSGWGTRRSGDVEGVYVVADGRPYPAFHGARRRDLAWRRDESGYEYAGFGRSIPTAELGPGKHELSVVAATDAGKTRLDLNGGERLIFELE